MDGSVDGPLPSVNKSSPPALNNNIQLPQKLPTHTPSINCDVKSPTSSPMNRKIKVVVKSNKREQMKTVTVIHSNAEGLFDNGTSESMLKVPMNYDMKNIMAHIKKTLKNSGQASKLSIQSMVTKVVNKNAIGVPIGPTKIVESHGHVQTNGMNQTNGISSPLVQKTVSSHVPGSVLRVCSQSSLSKSHYTPVLTAQKLVTPPGDDVKSPQRVPNSSPTTVVSQTNSKKILPGQHSYCKRSRRKKDKCENQQQNSRPVILTPDDIIHDDGFSVPPGLSRYMQNKLEEAREYGRGQEVLNEISRKRKLLQERDRSPRAKALKEQNYMEEENRTACHRIRPRSMLHKG